MPVQKGGTITYFSTLSIAGFAATAISYGLGRVGFGLFVPEFRTAFDMSTTTVGFISSAAFLGFFLALMLAQSRLNRRGPRDPVLWGMLSATIGLGLVAVAPNVPVLASGVVLAASSAGFAWTPFNDAVHRKVWESYRPQALSRISTGTSIGIVTAAAGALAVAVTGVSWRLCWAVFAVAAAIVLIVNWGALRSVERAPQDTMAGGWRYILQAAAIPLGVVAFVMGATSAIFITFAADRIVAAGGLTGVPRPVAPALVFGVYGFVGLTGLLTGKAHEALGLPWLLRLLLLSGAGSMLAFAFVPGSWAGVILSAGLQGVHVMMTSAVLAFWSERLFPGLPSLGFTVTVLATAAGSMVGPGLAGLVSDAYGVQAMFLFTAALPAATAVMLRARYVREWPAGAVAT